MASFSPHEFPSSSKNSPKIAPSADPGQRGMTLLELMISMVILMLGMTAVMMLSATVIGMTGWAADVSVGTNLGAAGIERLQLEDFSSFLDEPSTEIISFFAKTGEVVAAGDAATDAYFTVVRTIVPEESFRWAEVEASIRWVPDGRGDLSSDANCPGSPCRKVTLNARIYPQ